MTETTSACIRGCAMPRQHLGECVDEDCRGCLPRRAEHGHLCRSCHLRLRNLVRSIWVQWALLEVTAGAMSPQALTAETQAKTHQKPRTSSDAPHPSGLYARQVAASASESEPVRVAALDAAQELSDWLSCVVDMVCSAHGTKGPARLTTGGDARQWKWHPLADDGAASDFDPIVKHGSGPDVMRGQYILTDPPARFAVRPASDWLSAWLDRFESLEVVGDEMEAFGEIMSRCHALAPWREAATRLPGIPCPSCSRASLMRFSGDEDVQCTTPYCRELIPPGRYAIWVRMLADERMGA